MISYSVPQVNCCSNCVGFYNNTNSCVATFLYLKEYWGRGSTYNHRHTSDFGSFFVFFFFNYRHTRVNPQAAQSAKAHAETNICIWTSRNVLCVLYTYYRYYDYY